MRHRQVPLHIAITYSDEKADLSWVTGMLVRWSQSTPFGSAAGSQPAGVGTPETSSTPGADLPPHSFTSRPA
jgi:hypothetical protein